MIIDGMDQNKTDIPHFINLAKSVDTMWKIRTHLTGVILHGHAYMGYFDINEWPHDPNLTMNIILQTLLFIKEELPSVLYIQMDNCARDNKNRWVFAFACLLVEKRVFSKVKINFLMVGHTHEDIDQFFSRLATWLRKHCAVTLPQLFLGLQQCYTPDPIVFKIRELYDIKGWLDPHLNIMSKHSNPHCFRIKKDNTGKALMHVKKWSTDKEWLPCAVQEGKPPYLLLSHPDGQPNLVPPDYDALDLDRLQSDVTRAESFMTGEERAWWRKWLADKQKEGKLCQYCLIFF
jgi:hypothetical protein